MPSIITVTVPIELLELGPTYAYEHLLGAPPDWSPQKQNLDFTMLSFEEAAHELGLFKLAGGGGPWLISEGLAREDAQAMLEYNPATFFSF